MLFMVNILRIQDFAEIFKKKFLYEILKKDVQVFMVQEIILHTFDIL